MAFQVGSTCYETALQAAEAASSGVVGSIVGQAGAAHSVSVSSVSADTITYVLSPVTGGTAITHVAPFAAQPCNMLQSADGLAIGWLIGAAWIGMYCVLFLTRALRGETGDSYGNA